MTHTQTYTTLNPDVFFCPTCGSGPVRVWPDRMDCGSCGTEIHLHPRPPLPRFQMGGPISQEAKEDAAPLDPGAVDRARQQMAAETLYGAAPGNRVSHDTRITSLHIDNLPVHMIGEVLEVLEEHFGSPSVYAGRAVEINLTDRREHGS